MTSELAMTRASCLPGMTVLLNLRMCALFFSSWERQGGTTPSSSGLTQGHTFARWLASVKSTGREQRTDVFLRQAEGLTPRPRSH